MQLIKWLKEKNLISQGHISLSRIIRWINNALIYVLLYYDVLNYVKFNIVVEAWFTMIPIKDLSIAYLKRYLGIFITENLLY